MKLPEYRFENVKEALAGMNGVNYPKLKRDDVLYITEDGYVDLVKVVENFSKGKRIDITIRYYTNYEEPVDPFEQTLQGWSDDEERENPANWNLRILHEAYIFPFQKH